MALLIKFLQYFFDPGPRSSFKYLIPLVIVVILTLAASIAFRFLLKKIREDKVFKKLFRSLPGKLQTLALLLAIYLGARYENMPFISTRIILFVLIGSEIYLIIKYAQIYLKSYPQMKREHQQQLHLNKYLPRKKVKR